jgi:hypothetical protein
MKQITKPAKLVWEFERASEARPNDPMVIRFCRGGGLE